MPDFNLDSNRGYAYHCWNWNRKLAPIWDPITEKFPNRTMDTVPELFCEGLGTGYTPTYNPNYYLELHYINYGNDGIDNADPGCGQGPGPHGQVTPGDKDRVECLLKERNK